MSPVKIVFKNMKLRLLSTLLTIGSVALAASLVIAVQTLERETEQGYTQTSVGFDLILAAPGSRMQTTLNTIYHLETSTGVIPGDVYQIALRDGRIDQAFPVFVGDNYRGVRVVGTSAGFIAEGEPRSGQPFQIAEGRNFERPFEAVIGSNAARRLGIGIGHTFFMTHGVSELDGDDIEPHVHDEFELVITGILEPSRTAHDNVIFTSIYSAYAVHYHAHDHDHDHDHEHNDHDHAHGHDHDHDHDHEHEQDHNHDHGEDHDHASHSHGSDNAHNHSHTHRHSHSHHAPADTERLNAMTERLSRQFPHPLSEYESRVSRLDAVLLSFGNQAAALQIAGMINMPTPQNPLLARNMMRDPFFAHKDELMAVVPAMQIQELMSIIGNAELVLRYVGWLVFIVALFGVLVAIYNTMEERRRDIAIIRSLGARRGTVLGLILLEAGFIVGIGCILGLAGGIGIVAATAPFIAETAGIIVSAYAIDSAQFVTLLTFVLLGILAGIIPALKAYRTDVVANLAP
ncbi:MAG: ABC transporter permease [Balneolales bacterium]|nr:ABC transporter permease [Balneolales bacterium]